MLKSTYQRKEFPMKINAAFARYTGEPVSIHSVIMKPKNGSEVLVIAQQGKISTKKAKENEDDDETVLIVDSNMRENYDMLFTQDRFADALDAYKIMQTSKQLIIDTALAGKYSPDNSIEMDGISSNGKIEYRSNNINNGQMAVLASCLFFVERNGLKQAQSFADRMQNFFLSI